MRIDLVSDTHGEHNSIRVPEGDILIHAGDLTPSGGISEVAAAAKWLGSLPHRYKIAIAGNHDVLFERSPTEASSLLRSAGVIYLQDKGISIEGLSIYGSPWQPEFMHWAFNVPRGELAKYWDQIPKLLDILITHGPPYGILDQRVPAGTRRLAPWEDEEPFAGTDPIGVRSCSLPFRGPSREFMYSAIFIAAMAQTQNKHTTIYDASICNEDYEPVHKPWMIDLVPRS